MAVETATHPPAAHSGTGKGKQSWISQHKAVAALAGGGAIILFLGHKGGKAGTSGSTSADVAANAAAEQAAIDTAVGQASQNAAAFPTSGGSGSSGDTGLGGGTTTDTGSASAGAGDNTSGSSDPTGGGTGTGNTQLGPVNITVNNPASQLKAPKKKPTPSTKKKPPNTTKVKAGTEKPGTKPATTTHHRNGSAPAPAHTPAPAAKKPAPAPKKPAAASKPATHKPRGSVMHDGRTFDGARGARVGPTHTTADGVTHQTVTIDYGGYSETHMSHNRGQSWTDNVPGMTPPSRGVPLVRLGTR